MLLMILQLAQGLSAAGVHTMISYASATQRHARLAYSVYMRQQL
jgi:hypothetical protein